MPINRQISCSLLHGTDPGSPFPELLPNVSEDGLASCYVPVEVNPNPTTDYSALDLPYSVHWSIDPALLVSGGIQVQIEVDGCQKGQPRCYEAVGPDGLSPASSISGIDDGFWVVPDGTRRRPWVMGEIKTTHPHSALADKYILDRVGSVSVTFSRANVVPTSLVVPLVPAFNGGAPLPDRMRGKLSHWTRLGYIEKHPPAPEVGLVADEVHEVIAQFTFFYRSKAILQRLLPTLFLSDIRISFPTVPSTRSVRSNEEADTSRSEEHGVPFEARRASVLRRAFGASVNPRHSLDGSLPTHNKPDDKEEFGKIGKRVRAVSLRVAKRYSILGHKSPDKNSTSNVSHEGSPNKAASINAEDLSTIESLRDEILRLRLEITEIKKHLHL